MIFSKIKKKNKKSKHSAQRRIKRFSVHSLSRFRWQRLLLPWLFRSLVLGESAPRRKYGWKTARSSRQQQIHSPGAENAASAEFQDIQRSPGYVVFDDNPHCRVLVDPATPTNGADDHHIRQQGRTLADARLHRADCQVLHSADVDHNRGADSDRDHVRDGLKAVWKHEKEPGDGYPESSVLRTDQELSENKAGPFLIDKAR